MSDDAQAHTPGKDKFLVCADRRPQSRVAARYAAMRARNTGGRVALLHVMEPAEFQHWVAVGDVMEDERRVEAEILFESTATEIRELVGSAPEVILREGDIGEEILARVEADPSIDPLVVGRRGARRRVLQPDRLPGWQAGRPPVDPAGRRARQPDRRADRKHGLVRT